MPTDTERREVARRLRKLARDVDEVSDFDLARTFGLEATSRYGYDSGDVLRLADLIEPSEPKVRCVAEVKVDGEQLEKLVHDAAVELTGIDRDALLALAEELDGLGLTGFSSGWSSGAVNVGSFARRIRKALGVTDG